MNRADRRTERLRRTVLLVGTDDRTESRRLRAARQLARRRTPMAMRVLAELLVAHPDRNVRRIAEGALPRARDQAAIDAVCDVVIATDNVVLEGLAERHGWLPSDPARRALMLFLMGDFDQYTSLDGDGSLLAVAHAAADENTRARLARCAREAGRAEWIRVASQSQTHRRVDLTEVEWEALIDTLVATEHFEHLAQLVRQAPAIWAARLLARLPKDHRDRGRFDELVRLARAAAAVPMTGGPFAYLAELERPYENAGIHKAVVTPSGELLAASGYTGEVWLSHLPSGALVGVLKAAEPGHTYDPLAIPYEQKIESLATTPDGGLLAAGGADGTVRLWHLPSGKPAGTVRAGVVAVAFTPDSQQLLTFNPPRMWRLPDLAPVGELPYVRVGHFWALSSDGRRLATELGGRLHVSRFPSGEEIGRLDKPAEWRTGDRYDFTPDGRLLVRTGRGTWAWRPPNPAATGLRMDRSRLLTTVQDTLLVGEHCGGLRVWRYRPSAVVEIADKPVAEITPQDLEKLHRSRDDPGERALAAFTAALARRYTPGESKVDG